MYNYVPNCSRQQAEASVGPTVVSVLNTEVLTWRTETRELKARLIFGLAVPETPLAREAKVIPAANSSHLRQATGQVQCWPRPRLWDSRLIDGVHEGQATGHSQCWPRPKLHEVLIDGVHEGQATGLSQCWPRPKLHEMSFIDGAEKTVNDRPSNDSKQILKMECNGM